MFEVGTEYRRAQLLEFVGSKQAQSGIIWGSKQPGCVIVTSGGRHSKNAGYEDTQNPDGSWIYFGQGEKGDQDPKRYANRLLIEGQRSILLFKTSEPTAAEVQRRREYSKRYRFEGMFAVRGWEWYEPGAGGRAGDRLLLFHLVPAEDSYSLKFYYEPEGIEYPTPDSIDGQALLQELRTALLSRDKQPLTGAVSTKEYKRASAQTRAYAKLRAGGVCEYCGNPAPFVDLYGLPFLEVHHLHRLADDGPDAPDNVAALCPNCHREAHFGREGEYLRAELESRILVKEQRIDEHLSTLGQ
jgi:5-methylcytosine-specific restriction protein A